MLVEIADEPLGSLQICACLLSCFSCAQLFVTPRAVARQAPLSVEILQARILEWVVMASSRGSSQPREQTFISCCSCIAGGFFTSEPPDKYLISLYV